MPTLVIGQREVEVDDGFLKLSPAEQNRTVEGIAKQLGAQPAAPQEIDPAPQPVAPQPRGLMSRIDDGVRVVANGLTLGLADRFAAGMGSATGIGGTSGDYAGNLRNEQQRTEQFEHENPWTAAGLGLAGGALVPLGAVGAAAKGASLGTKTLYGMGAGAGIGGAQGAFSSKDLTDLPQTGMKTVQGGIIGGGIGAVIPGGARIIGSGWNAASNYFRGNVADTSRGASRHLMDAMQADGPAAVRARMQQLGPDAMLADAGPSFLGKAQGASLNSDEGRTILQRGLTARNEGTNQRINADVNRVLGPAEDPLTVSNAIRARRSEVDAVNYPAALDNARPVDTSGVLAELGQMVNRTPAGSMEHRALTNLRDMMMVERNGRLMPQSDPQLIHRIKGEVDNIIQYDAPGLGVPAAALSRQQGALKHMRGLINDALENQVPGYMAANRQSAALARRGDAVELGTAYLGGGKTTASPGRFADEFTRLEPGKQIAFAKGSRGEIERQLGTKASDLVALKSALTGDGKWNAEKLATVHGRDEADQLLNSVDRNLKFRDTHNKVVENSQTAQRTAAKDNMKPTPATETKLVNPNMTLIGLGLAGTRKAAGYGYNALRPDPTRNFGEVAEVLTAQGAARDRRVQDIIDALDRRKALAGGAVKAGERTSLIAAIAAHGEAQRRRRQKQEPQ